ncbi:hypothetical protein B0H14DRAFT_2634300 [Mycena olivaceomarginata]|nr:hypothetical protein B0H14DRAFT_2634300 [Mycena olivaceomarginata]
MACAGEAKRRWALQAPLQGVLVRRAGSASASADWTDPCAWTCAPPVRLSKGAMMGLLASASCLVRWKMCLGKPVRDEMDDGPSDLPSDFAQWEDECVRRWLPAAAARTRPAVFPPSSLLVVKLRIHANASSSQGDYFPDYQGGDNYDAACDYLLHRFVSLNQSAATKQICAHYTCATDTQQIKFVLSAIQDILLQLHLRECGLL